ncbi:hypothetical protein MBLNU230_g1383t1 [Neophaeotheca triangularis]
MPREHKKRGRRGEGSKKRKLEEQDGFEEADPQLQTTTDGTSKRRKASDPAVNDEDGQEASYLALPDDSLDAAYPHPPMPGPGETPFFGLLDESEQEYFSRANEMLEANAFAESEERELFVENVWKEAKGKELKIACSQSCSRLMERLIASSGPEQIKGLWRGLEGNFVHLMGHRFASHCCESLFLKAAPHVSDEVVSGQQKASMKDQDPDEIYVSMENLFLHTLAELEGNVGYLMMDRFASHPLRVLLLVFSGAPLDSTSTKRVLASKRKEGITANGTNKANDEEEKSSKRPIPDSFSEALDKLISASVAGLDTDKLRALATHPIGNPTLQLLLQLELSHFGKDRAKDENSVIKTLLPDDPITAESSTAAFINGLIYDPIGSHLVEKIIENAPGKLFKNLYRTFFKERIASFARNEIAQYVVIGILERLSRPDLLEAHELLAPTIPALLERNRTAIVRTLIERCVVRDVDTKSIAAAIDSTYHGPEGFEIRRLLKVEEAPTTNGDGPSHNPTTNGVHEAADPSHHFQRESQPVKVQFNLLAQSMLLVPGSLSALILDSIITIPTSSLLSLATDPIATRTLQAALTTRNASIINVRKLLNPFRGHFAALATSTAGSHVVDCAWEGTHGLAFLRERIAEELAEAEAELRESSCGRAVWRNWKMDMYKRRRGDWVKQSQNKASNDGFQSFEEVEGGAGGNGRGNAGEGVKKTPLQAARERHARNKAAKEKDSKGQAKAQAKEATGSNGTALGPKTGTVTS